MQGFFIIDLLSCIPGYPLDSLISGEGAQAAKTAKSTKAMKAVRALKLTKAMRMLKMGKVIEKVGHAQGHAHPSRSTHLGARVCPRPP